MKETKPAGRQNNGLKASVGIGFRVGRLSIVGKTGKRKNGYMVWECRCDCGTVVLLDTRTLQRGTVQDCGCISRVKPGQKDLTGKRFGRLVALQPTDQRDCNGSVVWRCLCDCGKECEASARQMKLGYKKSCGCLGHPPLKKFTGKRFGKLIVLSYAGKKDGMHQWRCQCDCGNIVVVGQSRLQSGKTKSCGCIQSQIYKENLKLIDGTSVTILESVKRRPLSSRNSSGYTGVYWDKKREKWVAQIGFKGKNYYLGTYLNLPDAVKARRRGEEMYDHFLEWYYSTIEDRD